jgi:hypothetical protein
MIIPLDGRPPRPFFPLSHLFTTDVKVVQKFTENLVLGLLP